MTYREDFTLSAELMERVSQQGFDILPELSQQASHLICLTPTPDLMADRDGAEVALAIVETAPPSIRGTSGASSGMPCEYNVCFK